MWCRKCFVEKSEDDFDFRVIKGVNVKYKKCKLCIEKERDYNKLPHVLEKRKQYYEANKQRIKERHDKWKEDNADHIKEYTKKKYHENREEHLKKNNEWWHSVGKFLRKEDFTSVVKDKIYRHRHRDKNKGLENDLTEEFIIQLIEDQEGKCFYCQTDCKLTHFEPFDVKQWTIDRLNNAKGHTQNNVVIACYSCNAKNS